MSKRKLSKQQQTRITANQSNELSSDDSSEDLSALNQGLVISHFGQQLEVEPLYPSDDGSIEPTVRCFQRSNLPQLVTGDRVRFQRSEDGTAVVLAVEPRENEFYRPGFKGKLKPVAANIDTVLLVVACLPQLFSNLIDRYLVAIEALGLNVTIVLNKVDAISESEKPNIDNIMSIYEALGYDLHRVSAETGEGIDALEVALKGKTTVLVGQSGVGKSSLVNRLSKQHSAEVGPLSIGKEKGTHTTTTARLFHLPVCDLIDSPGIREFALGHISPDQLINGYPELSERAQFCKFRDCSHKSEPECAIQIALENNEIARERVNNYFQILDSIIA